MIKAKPLIISIAISLGVGLLSALTTSGSMADYENIVKPILSPPGILFPIVWSILFILMGISAYRIYISNSPEKKDALLLYGIQLIVNFVWPIIFFNAQQFLLAFIWLVILWVLVLFMIIRFKRIDNIAAYLQIPYLVWLTFAAYLNIAIYLLNQKS